MVYGVLEVPSLRLRYVSAGHPPMLLAHAGRDLEWLASTAVPIGVVGDAVFREKVVTLQAGDRVLLYSDGITEAPNQSGEMFGTTRPHRMMADTAALSLEAILHNLLEEVLAWSRSRVSDDLSLLALEVHR